ncbi:MAG: hypothetical protein KC643_13210 [Nitrospira sp.]|nr:hypothetical protein [Nitrospira sp.]
MLIQDTFFLTAMILLGLSIFPIMLSLMEKLFAVSKIRVSQFTEALGQRIPRLFTWIGERLKRGRAVDRAIIRIAGDLTMIASGFVVSYAEWMLAIATLGPLLGIPGTGNITELFELLGGSLVVSTIVFGLPITDLGNLTGFTAFSDLKKGRKAVWYLSVFLLILTFFVVIAMAAYRLGVINYEQLPAWGIDPSWLDVLQVCILIPLAGIYLMAVAFCVVHIDGFFAVLTATVAALGGVTLSAMWGILKLAEYVLELIHGVVVILQEYWASVMSWVSRSIQALGQKYKEWKNRPRPMGRVDQWVACEEHSLGKEGSQSPQTPPSTSRKLEPENVPTSATYNPFGEMNGELWAWQRMQGAAIKGQGVGSTAL